MPYLIEMFIVVPLIFPILFQGNNGVHSLTLNLFNNHIAIIPRSVNKACAFIPRINSFAFVQSAVVPDVT